jgi:aryl-alcohol dehydrogenase-like predicted oxidoreductase
MSLPDWVIATKGGWNRPAANQWTDVATPAHLRKPLEERLKRLRLDRIDVYQLHIPDPLIPIDTSGETLAQAAKRRRTRLVALSNGHPRTHRGPADGRYGWSEFFWLC